MKFRRRARGVAKMKHYLFLAALAAGGFLVAVAARGFTDAKGITKGTA